MSEKAQSSKQQAILEQQNELLQLKLQESKNRESKQKQMYDSVMNAFGTSQPLQSAPDMEAERKKLTAELIANEISKDHPKVKDIVADALLGL